MSLVIDWELMRLKGREVKKIRRNLNKLILKKIQEPNPHKGVLETLNVSYSAVQSELDRRKAINDRDYEEFKKDFREFRRGLKEGIIYAYHVVRRPVRLGLHHTWRAWALYAKPILRDRPRQYARSFAYVLGRWS